MNVPKVLGLLFVVTLLSLAAVCSQLVSDLRETRTERDSALTLAKSLATQLRDCQAGR